MRRITAIAVFAALALFSRQASAQAIYYDNTVNFSSAVSPNGGAGVINGNTITRMVADDINFGGPSIPYTILGFQFSVSNNPNANSVTARPRVRFYDNNGAGGGPGTFIVGFTFNPITFPPNGLQIFNAITPPFNVDGSFWAGITFDNNTGGTGATAADLNNLGQLLFNPPTAGSSADLIWVSSTNGDFLVNNPGGSLIVSPFGGNPVGNFGWQFTIQSVPEPSALMLVGLAVPALWLRRRRASVN